MRVRTSDVMRAAIRGDAPADDKLDVRLRVRTGQAGILYGPLPDEIDVAWVERGGQRWLVVRDSLTIREAKARIGEYLAGDANARFDTTVSDPKHPGTVLALTTGPIPAAAESAMVERHGRRWLVISDLITVAQGELVARRWLSGGHMLATAVTA